MQHLLGIDELTVNEIHTLLAKAREFELAPHKLSLLKDKSVVNLFFENSTRTRTSFEMAGKKLGADVINFNVSQSSQSKGESLLDTAKNIQAMHPHFIICRHSSAGASHLLAKHLQNVSIINAGDGWHEHPTQALLDIFTVQSVFSDFKNLRVAIVGDILHSRVARSNILGFQKMGASVAVVGPDVLLPKGLNELGVDVYNNLHGISDADVVMMLRVQHERLGMPFTSLAEYAKYYGLHANKKYLLKPDAIILHPGPVNRGVELDAVMADGAQSMILSQVSKGVAVRMAVLALLKGAHDFT